MNDADQTLANLFLIGHMRVVGPDGEEIFLRNRKTRAILALLSLTEGKRIPRNRLVALLWDQAEDAQARMNLRHALSELNRLVNRRIPGLIEIERGAVRLNTELC